jgi:hypothetical protein
MILGPRTASQQRSVRLFLLVVALATQDRSAARILGQPRGPVCRCAFLARVGAIGDTPEHERLAQGLPCWLGCGKSLGRQFGGASASGGRAAHRLPRAPASPGGRVSCQGPSAHQLEPGGTSTPTCPATLYRPRDPAPVGSTGPRAGRKTPGNRRGSSGRPRGGAREWVLRAGEDRSERLTCPRPASSTREPAGSSGAPTPGLERPLC